MGMLGNESGGYRDLCYTEHHYMCCRMGGCLCSGLLLGSFSFKNLLVFLCLSVKFPARLGKGVEGKGYAG